MYTYLLPFFKSLNNKIENPQKQMKFVNFDSGRLASTFLGNPVHCLIKDLIFHKLKVMFLIMLIYIYYPFLNPVRNPMKKKLIIFDYWHSNRWASFLGNLCTLPDKILKSRPPRRAGGWT